MKHITAFPTRQTTLPFKAQMELGIGGQIGYILGASASIAGLIISAIALSKT